MTTNQLYVLELIKYSLWGRCNRKFIDENKNIDLKGIWSESIRAKMSSVVFDGLGKLLNEHVISIEDGQKVIYENWKMQAIEELFRNKVVIQVQTEITEMLDEADVEYCILKGSSVAKNFPKPLLRTMGDIDVFVPPHKFDDACKCFCNADYEEVGTYSEYHTAFHCRGIEIEVHNSFAGLPVGKTRNEVYFLKDACDRRVLSKIEGFPFEEPCMVDNALILLFHFIHHVTEEAITIRQICDWMMFVNANVDDRAWNEQVKHVLDRCGLTKCAIELTRICSDYLGFDNFTITWYRRENAIKNDKLLDFAFVERLKIGHGMKREGLPRDIWDYQRQRHVNYDVRLIARIIYKYFCREKTADDFIKRYKNIRKIRRKLVELNLFSYRDSKDYALQ